MLPTSTHMEIGCTSRVMITTKRNFWCSISYNVGTCRPRQIFIYILYIYIHIYIITQYVNKLIGIGNYSQMLSLWARVTVDIDWIWYKPRNWHIHPLKNSDRNNYSNGQTMQQKAEYYRIFDRGVPCLANDCTCGMWCRGLTPGLQYVDPFFGHLLLNNNWFVSLTQQKRLLMFCVCTYIYHNIL